MAKEEKKRQERFPQPGVPTVNPITGKEFSNDQEKQAFVDEQKAKLEAMHTSRLSRRDKMKVGATKILKIFTDAGVTEEEVRLVFGSRAFTKTHD